MKFKRHYVASNYQATLTGSYIQDEREYPGFSDEVDLLLLIDAYAEDIVANTMNHSQQAWASMHGKA